MQPEKIISPEKQLEKVRKQKDICFKLSTDRSFARPPKSMQYSPNPYANSIGSA